MTKRMAVLAAGMTLLLILAGGFVTTTRTGDSISGWPFLWGKLEPGFPVEWAHRAVAMVVWLVVGALAIWLRRPLGWAAFGAVSVQALIGGLRIAQYAPVAVAIVHAIFAQVVFCIMVSLAFAGGTTTTEGSRGLGVAATGAAFLQLVAGAVTRHTGAGLAVHLAGAGLVLVLGVVFASRLALTPLRRGAFVLLALLGGQIALGIGAWAITAGGFVRSHESPVHQIVTVTAHVAGGALVLATMLVLTLRCRPQPELNLAPA
jgi:heme A synthase